MTSYITFSAQLNLRNWVNWALSQDLSKAQLFEVPNHRSIITWRNTWFCHFTLSISAQTNLVVLIILDWPFTAKLILQPVIPKVKIESYLQPFFSKIKSCFAASNTRVKQKIRPTFLSLAKNSRFSFVKVWANQKLLSIASKLLFEKTVSTS